MARRDANLPARRLRLALDLFELAEALLRQRVRRTRPGVTEAEVEAVVAAWRTTRAGAEQGDAPGSDPGRSSESPRSDLAADRRRPRRPRRALGDRGGIEAEVTASADRLEILPGFVASVATIGYLLALKVLARDDRTRPQDLDDIFALLREASPADLDAARTALALITSRGYARDRRLGERFEAVLAERADG